MSDYAIEVENLSKRYILSHKTGEKEGLRHVIESAVRSPLGFIKDLKKHRDSKEEFWASKDLNFKISPGEVVGIIGRNGAGKSTLLKLLSRITAPTTGKININGRVASLLEVGTGFHPELTGRENIYLNGSILGMRRDEIRRKFDEIVEFSEVEKFLDTPVKRYSSGMYVRLAFSVAAHLDPEILIVDEVLAVGDADFQKKCMGKMDDVATRGGRTVLFVSHNMPVIQNLCSRCLLLDKGQLISDGKTADVVREYSSRAKELSQLPLIEREDRVGDGVAKITSVSFHDSNGLEIHEGIVSNDLKAKVKYSVEPGKTLKNCRIHLAWGKDMRGFMVLSTELTSKDPLTLTGDGEIEFLVPRLPIPRGEYDIASVITSDYNRVTQDWVEDAIRFTVTDGDYYGTGKLYDIGWEGKTTFIDHSWTHRTGL